jgi:hypothetical protein
MVTRYDSHNIQAAVVMIGFGGAILYRALDHYRRKLKIEDTGTIPIKSAPQGFVELQGYAWPREGLVLNSVLANAKVVFYNLNVEHYVRSGKSGQWVSIYQEQTPHGFLIADPTGVALLNIDGGECDITRSTRLLKELNSTENTRLKTYLISKNVTINDDIFHSYRVTEGAIKPGSPLCITGFFRSVADKQKVTPATGLQTFLLQLNMAKKAPMWVMQHPVAVGQSSSVTISAPEAECFGVVGSNLESKEKLFFADCHRGELLTRLSKYLELKILGGSLLMALGIMILLSHF